MGPSPLAAPVQIRHARPGDAARLNDIYNHYVTTSAVTFDVDPFTPSARRAWLAQFSDTGRHQLFVAECAGQVDGYAWSHGFRPKRAYDTSVETSVYCAPHALGRGLGRALYAALFEALKREDVHRAYAGITLPNPASLHLHRSFGFASLATYTEVGRKLGRYWDVLWLEKPLGGAGG